MEGIRRKFIKLDLTKAVIETDESETVAEKSIYEIPEKSR
jgi:hypothetical protein